MSPKGIVSTSPETFKARQGDNVTLTCSTGAHESSTTEYVWLHNIADAVCTNADCSDGIYNFNLPDEGIRLLIKLIIDHFVYDILQKP